ncbi:PREDICTED: suppressor of tumorigenicity 14 protein-like, partial [Nicrophorus vespilloides]|uniref:Suppressor of tumorigenicity 14 protein-like n=1 Tax=Nicrophorus vespilloides TaxID=110193 RepID=A0ABM1MD63_NICVS
MWWIICIFLFLPGSVISRPRCGGTHTAARGVIQSPNFPNKFPVPIHCEWIIDAQHVTSPNSTIKVYFTQLFVFEGLSFKEYQIYDSTYQLNGRDIHTVTETNVTKVSVIESKQDYLVITLKLDTIESTHLRVLDHLLDVYGFNITYEISPGPPRMDRCTMMDCGFTGTCYDHYTRFSCDCFDGYEGPKCSEGPNSLCTPDICKNGGTCTHIGDSAVRCECGPGFTGEYCDARFTPPAKECEDCLLSCPFDGREENICKCPGNGESPNETRNTDAVVAYAVTIKLMNVSNMKAAQLRGYIEGH